MNTWYALVDSLLPFAWSQHLFMKNALLAILLVSLLFGILGTMVVNNRMAFFSDAIGHSALTGIALGVLLGFHNPLLSMIAFALLLALAISYIKAASSSSPDTVIGVFSATAVALGIVILSRGGGFAKYSRYLIGDLLSITAEEILFLSLILIAVLLTWGLLFNRLLVVSVNPSLAKSRGVPVRIVEGLFAGLMAVIVSSSIQWVGILIINSLLVLPAASARNIAGNMRQYHTFSILISLSSGIFGLIASYYWGTATGATIVLFTALWYLISLLIKHGSR